MPIPAPASGAVTPSDNAIRAALLALARTRGEDKSFCPSEVARAMAEDWRPLMPKVRAVATALQAEGHLRCTQKGQDVKVSGARGPIRLSLVAGPSAKPR